MSFKDFKIRDTRIGRFNFLYPKLSKFPKTKSLWKYKYAFKKQLKRGLIDFYGPTTVRPKLNQISANKPRPFKLGKKYILNIPKSETHRFWFNKWQGQEVEIVGFYQHFERGYQTACVHKPGLGDLAVTCAWLKRLNKPKPCSCSTDIIWTKGCQCGGS
jgi:hypothetical protein